jgi:hypothetical protein
MAFLRLRVPSLGTGTSGAVYTLTAGAGSFVITGQDATLKITRRLVAEAGSFTLTGQAASLKITRRLVAEAGSFILTGQDATLTKTSPGSLTLVADAGSFILTGQPANLRITRRLAADAGSFTLTGQDATLKITRRLAADAGTFTLTGQPADLKISRRLVAGAGSFILTGQNATLRIVIPTTTSYEGQVIAYALAMLAASTTWADVCSESVPAKSRIILIDGGDTSITGEIPARNSDGDELDNLPPLAQISMKTPMIEEEIGVVTNRRSGTVDILVTITAPEDYHPAQAATWATNVIGGIKKDIKDQQGQVGKLAKVAVKSEPLMILDGTEALGGCFQTIIHIEWRA